MSTRSADEADRGWGEGSTFSKESNKTLDGQMSGDEETDGTLIQVLDPQPVAHVSERHLAVCERKGIRRACVRLHVSDYDRYSASIVR